MRWRRDVARGGLGRDAGEASAGWHGRSPTAACQPLASAVPGWAGKVLPWSCRGQALAPALSWVRALQTPDLLPCPCPRRSPAASPGRAAWSQLPPSPAPQQHSLRCSPPLHGGSAPHHAPFRLPVAQDGLCGCFLVLPPPQRASLCSGAHPGCWGGGGPQQHCCGHPWLVCPWAA